LKVVGKLPMWGIPGWFDGPGVPTPGTVRYSAHLDAKAQMAQAVNRLLPTDYIVLGNEPQLVLYTVYTPPETPVRHNPETCLSIAKHVVNAIAPEFTCKKIGPAMAGAIRSITDTFIRPVDFLKELKPILVEQNIKWCAVNAYPLVNSSPPNYTNYGQHYKEMADVYPLWPSECGIARKNVPGDTTNAAHLKALIDQVEGFSPGIFSYFIYRDFNSDGWGLQTLEDRPDPRRNTIMQRFADEPDPGEFVYYLELRTEKEMDTGIYLAAKQEAHVKISFFSQCPNESDDGALETIKNLTLGAYNPVTANVKADFKTKGDLAVVVSDAPLATASAWPAKFAEELYTIFPGLKL
jgi:hypothetical protein